MAQERLDICTWAPVLWPAVLTCISPRCTLRRRASAAAAGAAGGDAAGAAHERDAGLTLWCQLQQGRLLSSIFLLFSLPFGRLALALFKLCCCCAHGGCSTWRMLCLCPVHAAAPSPAACRFTPRLTLPTAPSQLPPSLPQLIPATRSSMQLALPEEGPEEEARRRLDERLRLFCLVERKVKGNSREPTGLAVAACVGTQLSRCRLAVQTC